MQIAYTAELATAAQSSAPAGKRADTCGAACVGRHRIGRHEVSVEVEHPLGRQQLASSSGGLGFRGDGHGGQERPGAGLVRLRTLD
jgi:hypothetical protein